MPEDASYDGADCIIQYYAKKYKPQDGSKSIMEIVTLMLVTKVYTGDSTLPLQVKPLPKILMDLKMFLNDPRPIVDASFFPIIILFL